VCARLPKNTPSIPEDVTLEEADSRYRMAVETRTKLVSAKQQLTLRREPSKYDKWQSEWDKWKAEVANVCDGETAEAIAQKCEQYEAFITSYKTKQEEWERVLRDLQETEKELEALRDIPLNPDCWACKLQPAMKRKDQLGAAYDKLKRTCHKAYKYMKQFEQHGDIPSLEKELKAHRKLYAARVYYEQTKEHMENEHRIWEETMETANELEQLQESIDTIEREIGEWSEILGVLQWNQWKEWNRKVEVLQQAVETWQSELDHIEAFLKEYDLRDKDMVLLQEETDKYEHHQQWQEQRRTYDQVMERYQKMMEYWELENEFARLQEVVGEHAKRIQRMKEKQQLVEQMGVLQKSRLRNQLQTVETDLETLQTSYETARVQLALSQTAWKRHQDKREQLVWYTDRVDEWTVCKQKLVQLEAKFIGDKSSSDGYKEWIYREKVVPLLEGEVNRFLSTIESIRLKIQYDKKCFIYFLEDRGNLPTLDKASGYQNFVVGLAMRLALSRIGAVGQNVRHLFIDEGFTACDVANIEKVPQLLRGVLAYGGYESIVIMSHLEQVQEACNCRVDIERKGMFSFVHYGDAYPTIAVKKTEEPASSVTAKKRGRPKKTDL
jgi:DNA repair exonuclease SbcCD ATPase subunit